MTPDQRVLRDALAGTPVRIATAAAELADPGVPAIPGEWSAREVTLHLAAVDEVVWQPRLDALIAEEFPHWPWVEPGLWSGDGDATFDGALAAFSRLRAATIARIDALDDDGWTRRGLHATYGELDVAALLRIEMNHDEEHLAQIRP
ncbi:MAG: DinB family protein [Chloroflexota bacterium]